MVQAAPRQRAGARPAPACAGLLWPVVQKHKHAEAQTHGNEDDLTRVPMAITKSPNTTPLAPVVCAPGGGGGGRVKCSHKLCICAYQF